MVVGESTFRSEPPQSVRARRVRGLAGVTSMPDVLRSVTDTLATCTPFSVWVFGWTWSRCLSSAKSASRVAFSTAYPSFAAACNCVRRRTNRPRSCRLDDVSERETYVSPVGSRPTMCAAPAYSNISSIVDSGPDVSRSGTRPTSGHPNGVVTVRFHRVTILPGGAESETRDPGLQPLVHHCHLMSYLEGIRPTDPAANVPNPVSRRHETPDDCTPRVDRRGPDQFRSMSLRIQEWVIA